MSKYQVIIPADAEPWGRRLQAPLNDALNRIDADVAGIRRDLADIATPVISGSRSGATVAVLAALLQALDARGIISDQTTA